MDEMFLGSRPHLMPLLSCKVLRSLHTCERSLGANPPTGLSSSAEGRELTAMSLAHRPLQLALAQPTPAVLRHAPLPPP